MYSMNYSTIYIYNILEEPLQYIYNVLQELLHYKRDELKKLWLDGVEQKQILELLNQIGKRFSVLNPSVPLFLLPTAP